MSQADTRALEALGPPVRSTREPSRTTPLEYPTSTVRRGVARFHEEVRCLRFKQDKTGRSILCPSFGAQIILYVGEVILILPVGIRYTTFVDLISTRRGSDSNFTLPVPSSYRFSVVAFYSVGYPLA